MGEDFGGAVWAEQSEGDAELPPLERPEQFGDVVDVQLGQDVLERGEILLLDQVADLGLDGIAEHPGSLAGRGGGRSRIGR